MHQDGAATLGVFLLVFAIVGFIHHVPMMATGERTFGLYTNGALLVSALRSGRSASRDSAHRCGPAGQCQGRMSRRSSNGGLDGS